MSLFSFQGKVSLGDRLPNGKLSKPIWCGNVPTCQLQLKTDTTDKTESFSGNRLQYGRLQKGKTATLNLTFDEWLSKNLTLGLYATELSVAAGSATGESRARPRPAGGDGISSPATFGLCASARRDNVSDRPGPDISENHAASLMKIARTIREAQ